MRRYVLPVVFLILAFNGPALATDGVLEINQACAVNSGCFAGDGAGFPVTISTSGSYLLTGNLDSTGSGVRTIVINADDVSLDLNGFVVHTTDRVRVVESANAGISISNGFVRHPSTSIGNDTVALGDRAALSHVQIHGHNWTQGPMVQLGSNSRVSDTTIAATNGGALATGSRGNVSNNVLRGGTHSACAVTAGDRSVIRSNITETNEAGICTGLNSIVIGNGVRGQMSGGIFAGGSSVLKDNVVANEAPTGITCGDRCMLSGNVVGGTTYTHGIKCGRGCRISGNTVFGSATNGIECGGACTVTDNVSTDNAGFGLFDAVGGTGYSTNQFSGNNGGNANPQVSGGIEMGDNICGGDVICP